MAMFKILMTLTGTKFEPGELRDSSEFPDGADFARLVKIGAVRPTGLGGFKGTADQAELLDQVEELTQKLGRLEEERNNLLTRAAQDGADWQAERKRLEEAVAVARLDNETLGLEVTTLRKANAELTAPVAELAEARKALAAKDTEIEALSAQVLAAKTPAGDGGAAVGEAGATTAPAGANTGDGGQPAPNKNKPPRR